MERRLGAFVEEPVQAPRARAVRRWLGGERGLCVSAISRLEFELRK
jgi:hypothetical protein